MCGRFFRDVSWSQYRAALTVLEPEAAPNFEPELDIRPTQRQPVIVPLEGGVAIRPMRWGLVPFWHKGGLKDFKLTTFNARSETAATAAAFREPWKKRRCLIPASGWYEWTGDKSPKTKWSFRRADGEWLAFAGLWDRCVTADQGEVASFTVLTAPSGEDCRDWHHREPVVLEREDWAAWLAGDSVSVDARPKGRFVVERA